MGNQNRNIESGAVYDLCFRVASGLPFATRHIVTLLIKSAVARANRDTKVDICHLVWMGNHPHMLIRALDAAQCAKFYMEVEKKITDAFKRLLGLKSLNLWEGRPNVAQVLDKEKVIERIVYFYLNPAAANLVESIDKYPGISSWKELLRASDSLSSESSEEIPWIRLPAIKKLKSRSFTIPEDLRLTKELTATATDSHPLTYKPNIWMKAFGVTDPEEIKAINLDIQQRVRTREAELCCERKRRGISVIGAYNLMRQPIMKDHTPKKKSRRIFALSSCYKRLTEFIEQKKALTRHCAALYKLAKQGEIVVWPAGVFPPPIPPLCNALYSG